MRISSAKPVKTSLFKGFVEQVLDFMPINQLDNLLERITAGRWMKKTVLKKLNSHGIVMGMLTGKHYAKPDPVNFQKKLLTRYNNKVAELLHDYEHSLAH